MLSFHFVDSFFFSAAAFQFGIIPLVYFFTFYYLCFRCYIQKTITKSHVKELYVFIFQEFYGFKS